jgi:uncharacterized protein (DUF2252 family)
MARSVHAYVRGNTARFYEWLAASDANHTVPAGPPVWICGDCHLGNLGPLADAEGKVDVQIRDLDQTVIGNPAHDLIRLGLSLETAARSSDLPGITTARMVEAMIDGYARALTPQMDDDLPEPEVVRSVRRKAMGRRWRNLAKERIEDVEPTIPLGKRFWSLTGAEREGIASLFQEPEVRQRTLELAKLDTDGRIRVVDAAYWRKGCSSLGALRYAVLLGVSHRKGKEAFALVDIKEAGPSVAPAASGADMPLNPAERVVAGAKALAPNLGERMIPATLLSTPVVLRELAPQDLKIEVEQFSRREAIASSAYLAYVIGLAHASQLDDIDRMDWHRLLLDGANQSSGSSWLWQTIVDLAARHEAGYLEHCRLTAALADGKMAA